MSFGQIAPQASPKQVQYLLSLIQKAGHTGFRDARGPLGLSQRQSMGKFSRTEATALIDQLLAEPGDEAQEPARSGAPISATDRLGAERAVLLRGMPAEVLADELVRRGWTLISPT